MNSEVFAEFSRELLNEKDVYFDARGPGYTRRIMRDMPIHEHTVTFPGQTVLMLDNGQKVTVTGLTVTGRDDEDVRTATVSPGHAPVIVDLATRARKAQADIGRLNDKLNHDDHKNHVHFKVGGILRDEPVVKAYKEYTPGAFPAGDSATLDTEGNITVTNTTGDVQAEHAYYGSSAAPLTVYVSSYGTLTVRNHYGHRIGFYAAGTWHTLTVY